MKVLCQIMLAQKDIILLSSISIIFYKTGARTGVENNRFTKFSISTGTYSIDDFNAKIKVQYNKKGKTGYHLKLST